MGGQTSSGTNLIRPRAGLPGDGLGPRLLAILGRGERASCAPAVFQTEGMSDVNAILAQQVDYYRARAPHYDDWWFRRGDHELGPVFADKWGAEIARLYEALEQFGPRGDVLELAAGTGIFSELLAPHAESLTLVDASPEVLERNRARIGAKNAEFVVADLFAWDPPRRYDTVVFTFWISHVPQERFAKFWGLVERALSPNGRVFFADGTHLQLWSAHVPEELRYTGGREASGIRSTTDLDTGIARRETGGRDFLLYKVFYFGPDLEEKVRALGWNCRVETTEWAFYWGVASRR